jgi:ABC-type glycerol-3-phosphate transport system substrate-binding protein
MRIKSIILLVILIILSDCTGAQKTEISSGVIPTLQASSSPTENSQNPSAIQPTKSTDQSITLTLWIPDDFAVNSREQVQKLLNDRVVSFTNTNPNIKVDLRYKNIGPQENMMELLNSTSRVAPSILPDVVLLNRNDMEIAALKGLLVPLDGYLANGIENEAYPGFISLGRLQGSIFGLPAAGDVLLLVGNQDRNLPVQTWQDFITSGLKIGTNFSDPGSIASVSLYLSAGGLLVDSAGKPHLDQEALTHLITTIRNTREHSVFPEWTILSSDWMEVSKHFRDGDTDFEINWYSSTRDVNSGSYSYQDLPGLVDKSASTLNGWYWSVANPAPERLSTCKELLAYLYQPVFAAIWSDTAGYLPVSSQQWPQNDVMHQNLQSILNSAEPLPDTSIMITVGPVIRDAVIRAYTTYDPIEEITAAAITRINQK